MKDNRTLISFPKAEIRVAHRGRVNTASFDRCSACVGYWDGMDIERTIDDIEQLEEMFETPDIKPLNASDLVALNRRHDEMLAHSPWFRLWQRYGVCCRHESPVLRLGEMER
jgi:hypothetical protein